MISIREWRPADTDGVVDVIRSVYDEYGFTWDVDQYHADLYDIQRFYFDQGDTFWVAEIDGRIVGTAALERFERIPGEAGKCIERNGYVRACSADCSLERLYVHPDARRKGVGSALTQHVIDQAKREGLSAMELWSDKRFGDAHRLYGRFGAVVVGDRICDDPDVSPEWGLLIRLD